MAGVIESTPGGDMPYRDGHVFILILIGLAGIAGFFYVALRDRRDLKRHAGYMFATVVFLIGGILQHAVPQLLDPLDDESVSGFQPATALARRLKRVLETCCVSLFLTHADLGNAPSSFLFALFLAWMHTPIGAGTA